MLDRCLCAQSTSHRICTTTLASVYTLDYSSNELIQPARLPLCRLAHGCMTCRNLLQLVLHMATRCGVCFARCWSHHSWRRLHDAWRVGKGFSTTLLPFQLRRCAVTALGFSNHSRAYFQVIRWTSLCLKLIFACMCHLL
jgi:hypothetical protein